VFWNDLPSNKKSTIFLSFFFDILESPCQQFEVDCLFIISLVASFVAYGLYAFVDMGKEIPV
jgi:hypothetical protein